MPGAQGPKTVKGAQSVSRLSFDSVAGAQNYSYTTVPAGSEYTYFSRYPNFLAVARRGRTGRRKPLCRNKLAPFDRFDTTPTCDSQTDRHRAMDRGVVVNFDLVERFPRPRAQQRGSLRPRAWRVAVVGMGAGGGRPSR